MLFYFATFFKIISISILYILYNRLINFLSHKRSLKTTFSTQTSFTDSYKPKNDAKTTQPSTLVSNLYHIFTFNV